MQYEANAPTQIAPLKGINKNIKLNLVTDLGFLKGYFREKDPDNRFFPNIYIEDMQRVPLSRRVLDLLVVEETRSVFGLTYKDLMDMDPGTLDYVEKRVEELAKIRIKKQKEIEGKT